MRCEVCNEERDFVFNVRLNYLSSTLSSKLMHICDDCVVTRRISLSQSEALMIIESFHSEIRAQVAELKKFEVLSAALAVIIVLLLL